MKRCILIAVLLFIPSTSLVQATEPNETFATSTILASGVLSVTDSLAEPTGGSFPDTVLANYDFFGIAQVSDDDGPYAGQGGSALYDIPTNSGQVEFVVSGYPDWGFSGAHTQEGWYEVFIETYDVFGDTIDVLSAVDFLDSGDYHDYSFVGDEYIYTYDVWTAPAPEIGDVDFFTFTGLPPGTEFSARTVDIEEINIDTILGWFDSSGLLIDSNDDIDTGNNIFQSMLTGIVPAEGELTFAVTGYDDQAFDGNHGQSGGYQLLLELDAGVLPGDYNNDLSVDAADYVVWRKGVAAGDYATWQANYGSTAGGGAEIFDGAVPEPSMVALLAMTTLLALPRCRP